MKRALLIAMIAALLPALAVAQPHGGPGRPGAHGHRGRPLHRMSAKQREQLRKTMRTARAAALRAEVALPASAHAKIVTILDGFDVQRQKIQRELHRTGRALHLLVRAGETDDALFKHAIDRMMAARTKSSALRAQEFAAMRKVLTPKQTAQLLMALPRIHESVHKGMRSSRKSRLRRQALELLKQRD